MAATRAFGGGRVAPGLVLAFALALAAPLSGCFECKPQLDVHHCRNEAGRCDTSGEVVVLRDAGFDARFPDAARLMDEVPVGGHGHAAWSEAEAQAFWAHHSVPEDRADKQVYVRDGDGLFHVRVLAC